MSRPPLHRNADPAPAANHLALLRDVLGELGRVVDEAAVDGWRTGYMDAWIAVLHRCDALVRRLGDDIERRRSGE